MKIGELFVDLGVNSGSAFNTLSNFAFQFNNIATTAEKVVGSMKKIFAPAVSNASLVRSLKDIATYVGETEKSIQGIRTAAGRTSRNPNLFGEMTGQLKGFTKERLEAIFRGNRDFFDKMGTFGFTNADLRGSPLQIMQRMVEVISGIENKSNQAAFAEMFGFSQESLRAWQKFFGDRENLENNPWNFTSEEIEQAENLYDNLARLSDNTKKVAEQFGQSLTPALNSCLGIINKWLESDNFRKFIEHPLDTTGDFFEDLYNKYYPDWLKSNTAMGGTVLAAGAINPYLGATAGTFFTGSLLGEGVTTGVLKARDFFDKNKAKNNPDFAKSVAYAFYRSKGFSESSAKAWVANLWAESALNPSEDRGDNGTAFGIAQWRGDRLEKLKKFAEKRGTAINDLMTQLEFTLSEEGESHKVTPERLNKLSLKGAMGVLVNEYERPKNKPLEIERRTNDALSLPDLESRIIGRQSSNVSNTTNNRSLTVNVRDERQANSVMDNFLYNPAVQYALT